jgi:hypothetical protein
MAGWVLLYHIDNWRNPRGPRAPRAAGAREAPGVGGAAAQGDGLCGRVQSGAFLDRLLV